MTSGGDATTFDVLARVFQIALAAVYLVVAFALIDRFTDAFQRRPTEVAFESDGGVEVT